MHKVSFTISICCLFLFHTGTHNGSVRFVSVREMRIVAERLSHKRLPDLCGGKLCKAFRSRGPANAGVDDASTASCRTERRPQRRPVRFIPFYGFFAFATFMVSRAPRSDFASFCSSSFAQKWMKNMRGSSLSM